MSVPVLINREGGTAKADPGIEDKVAGALKRAGLDPAIEMLDGKAIPRRCEALAKTGAKLVIVGGGDGTIGSAAAVLADTSTTLGVLPLGTLNHFARDLGFDPDLEKAAAALGKARNDRVDVAELNGRTFINNSAIGLYPLMVVDRESQQKRLGRSKRLALLVASLRTLVWFRHERLTLTIEGTRRPVDTPLLFVGNNDYHVDLASAGTRDSLSDGHLCVLILAGRSRWSLIRAVGRTLLGRSRPDDLMRLDDVTSLLVESRRSTLKVALDGEVETLKPPLEYRIRPKALHVLVP